MNDPVGAAMKDFSTRQDGLWRWAWTFYPVLTLVVSLLVVALVLWSNWTIVKRMGYPGIWSLMLYIPLVNVLVLFGLAFWRWPVQGSKSRARAN